MKTTAAVLLFFLASFPSIGQGIDVPQQNSMTPEQQEDLLDFEKVEEEKIRMEEEQEKKYREYLHNRYWYDPAWDEGRVEIAAGIPSRVGSPTV